MVVIALSGRPDLPAGRNIEAVCCLCVDWHVDGSLGEVLMRLDTHLSRVHGGADQLALT